MPIWDANNLSAPHTQRELAQIAEASASVFSRSNEQIDTLRAELAAEKAKSARLVDAAVYLRDDMLVRAECGIDRINGEQYRVVNAGNGAWVGFIEALAAYEVQP